MKIFSINHNQQDRQYVRNNNNMSFKGIKILKAENKFCEELIFSFKREIFNGAELIINLTGKDLTKMTGADVFKKFPNDYGYLKLELDPSNEIKINNILLRAEEENLGTFDKIAEVLKKMALKETEKLFAEESNGNNAINNLGIITRIQDALRKIGESVVN